MNKQLPDRTSSTVYLAAFALAAAVYIVLRPFLEPLAWSAVLVITTWPLYKRLLALFPRSPLAAAGIMTATLALLLLAVIVPIGLMVSKQFSQGAGLLSDWLPSGGPAITSFLEQVPLIGKELQNQLIVIEEEGAQIARFLANYHGHILGFAALAAKSALRGFFVLFMCLFSSFFLFLYGESISGQIRFAGLRLLGPRYKGFAASLKSTLRGAVLGTVATAIAQGVLAGMGYAAAGVPMPLAFAVITAFFSLIAFGAPLIYIPLTLYLAVHGAPIWHAAGLLLWSAAVVSTSDNLVRAYFISQSNRTPVLLVFMGVTGGLLAFGLIGIFIGPAVLAVAQIAWLEFCSPLDEKARSALI